MCQINLRLVGVSFAGGCSGEKFSWKLGVMKAFLTSEEEAANAGVR